MAVVVSTGCAPPCPVQTRQQRPIAAGQLARVRPGRASGHLITFRRGKGSHGNSSHKTTLVVVLFVAGQHRGGKYGPDH